MLTPQRVCNLSIFLCYRKQNSNEFHKNKIREEDFFEKKNQSEQIIPMSESCSVVEEELHVEKKMKSKITNVKITEARQ
jgi:hypothetical protein